MACTKLFSKEKFAARKYYHPHTLRMTVRLIFLIGVLFVNKNGRRHLYLLMLTPRKTITNNKFNEMIGDTSHDQNNSLRQEINNAKLILRRKLNGKTP